ncbi:MAG TPA: hypothetical protein VL285_06845, partial [Bryobacteraceae bacterium]|nr:hypothetical protein [Bryobacteraceae bacterium]
NFTHIDGTSGPARSSDEAAAKPVLTNVVARFTLTASMARSGFGNLSAPGTDNTLTGTSPGSFGSSTPRF